MSIGKLVANYQSNEYDSKTTRGNFYDFISCHVARIP